MAKGPLSVRWLDWRLDQPQAGSLGDAHITLENTGTVHWRKGIRMGYHWLDERGNAIVWDGVHTPLERTVEPGDSLRQAVALRAPIPPGRYRLSVDLVEEHRFWLAELGNTPLEEDVDVTRRDASEARAFLPEDAEPSGDWHARARGLHEEGYAAVGGAVEGRRGLPELAPYAPGGGRHPRFPYPLVCPSLLPGLVPNAEVAGLPAYRPDRDEPSMFDGRLVVRLRSRSGRRRA